MNKQIKTQTRFNQAFAVGLLLLCICFASLHIQAQSVPEQGSVRAANLYTPDNGSDFRVETVSVTGGAEIITIFAKQGAFGARAVGPDIELPLLSVLRDTLGDEHPENDRLRYVWVMNYTNASFWQKVSAFVPFLYTRTSNKTNLGTAPPPPVADMNPPYEHAVWDRMIWIIFKKLVLGQMGIGPKASILQYSQNVEEYRRSSIARALTVLSMYENVVGKKLLSDSESKEIQARLRLTDKTFGVFVQSENLGRVYERERANQLDNRGHNWELLRQYSEAQGLYFEPLELADGTTQNVLLWVAAEDIATNKSHKWERRFLNINDPWNDKKLFNWKGYTKVQWFDQDGRIVEPDTPDAKPKTMIPLALYGLDHTKIPIILIDFRDRGNAKRREITKRILNDLTSNVLSISQFSSLPYFLGRYIYDFVTGRMGLDINQTSRMRSYAQLKLLLALDETLDAGFREDIAHRLERTSMNPLDNDLDIEADLARTQYRNLIAYAKDPKGLPAKLDRDRREEMVKVARTEKKRALYTLGHFLSFGLYTHREISTPELLAKMDTQRQLEFYERFVNETAYASAKPEVDSNVDELRRALAFIAENGAPAKEKTAQSLAKIFAITDDQDMRTSCLTGLYRVDNSSAKKALIAIYQDIKVDARWRNLCAQYLKKALVEGQRITPGDAATIAGIAAN